MNREEILNQISKSEKQLELPGLNDDQIEFINAKIKKLNQDLLDFDAAELAKEEEKKKPKPEVKAPKTELPDPTEEDYDSDEYLGKIKDKAKKRMEARDKFKKINDQD